MSAGLECPVNASDPALKSQIPRGLFLAPNAFELLSALFDGHELTTLFIALGGSSGERILQLCPLLHRALTGIITLRFFTAMAVSYFELQYVNRNSVPKTHFSRQFF